MAAVILAGAVLTLFAQPPSARAGSEAFQSIISRQMEAFRSDDEAAAFAFASPYLQRRFQTPHNFMMMVRRGYQPVYRHRQVEFGNLTTDTRNRPVQEVAIVDLEGRLWTARYTFEQQSDGSWRIAAVTLHRQPGADV